MAEEGWRVIIIILVAVIIAFVVISILAFGTKNIAITVKSWIYGDEAQATTTTQPGDQGPPQGPPVEIETITRITEINPKLEISDYTKYNDWTGGAIKIDSNGGKARMTLKFNANVSESKLRDAIEVWQQNSWGSTKEQKDYTKLAYGAENGYQIGFTAAGNKKMIDVIINDKWSMFGRYYIVKFKEEYIQGYCQTPPRKIGDCKYLDEASKYLFTPSESVIKFQT